MRIALYRARWFQLQETTKPIQEIQITVGLRGKVDPMSGMILNLRDIDTGLAKLTPSVSVLMELQDGRPGAASHLIAKELQQIFLPFLETAEISDLQTTFCWQQDMGWIFAQINSHPWLMASGCALSGDKQEWRSLQDGAVVRESWTSRSRLTSWSKQVFRPK